MTPRDRIEAAIVAATEEERELCAKIADEIGSHLGIRAEEALAVEIAAAIRAPDKEPRT